MRVYEALTTEGGYVEVDVLEFVVIRGKVYAVVATPSGTVESLPISELRTRQRPDGTQWSYTVNNSPSPTILDARATGTRYHDL